MSPIEIALVGMSITLAPLGVFVLVGLPSPPPPR